MKLALCATVVAFFLPSPPASAQTPINTPILSSDENFRDLAGISAIYGGTGYSNLTTHGGAMRTGVFYRSEDLNSLSGSDSAIITSLGVRYDIDLRTTDEIIQAPDNVPSRATWLNVNIYGSYAVPPTNLITTQAQAINYMKGIYEGFVADAAQRAAFRTVLLHLAHDQGPILYHCSAGKDRTGWTSMLLETIAGVSPATRLNDYLATNNYAAVEIAQLQANLTSQGKSYMAPITVVDASYMQAGLTQVATDYGSLDAYLTEGIGLTRADIYVLRAKMVYYSTLPGQSQLQGNAAAGAAFLNSLQNSPLSGSYTAFNYYLQSAIDAENLGGVETQVGAQIHADGVSYLLRQPLWLDWAIAPYTIGDDIAEGQRRFWAVGLGNYLSTGSHSGVAASSEENAGTVVGSTYRYDERTSAFVGVGYNSGSIGSADANASVNTVLTTVGLRRGFDSLESGFFAAARADIGWAEYRSKRALAGGLGVAEGDSDGGVYSGRFDVGDVIRFSSLSITPQAGIRVANASLGSFSETGNELALNVHGITHTYPSLLADLEIALDSRQWRGWTIRPSVDLGYELALSSPEVETVGDLYGFTVGQDSAYDSWYLMKVGLGVTAQRNALFFSGTVNSLFGNESSAGVNAQLSLGFGF